MGFDFAVLGATGMQGRIVSRDLLEKGYSVLMCGRDKKRILGLLNKHKKSGFKFIEMGDIKKVAGAIRNSGADVVVNCIEGDWNLSVLKACVLAGAHCIDLGSEIWMTKKQFEMDSELKRKNLISITGCGSVPGIGNVMLRYASEKFDRIETIEAGFAWDSNIKKFVVPFSIQSILWEFTQPALIVRNGVMEKKLPMESVRNANRNYVGKQKEFFAEHPEPWTFYRYFRGKGLKHVRFYAGFPEHSFEKINLMIKLGLDKYNPVLLQGKKIAPAEFLRALLKDIKMPKGYTEKENLWVDIHGVKNGKKKRILMECLVPTLRGWEDAGCNIDTGIPASIIAEMIKKGVISERGSFSPEGVVQPEIFFKELRKRQMRVFENGKMIN